MLLVITLTAAIVDETILAAKSIQTASAHGYRGVHAVTLQSSAFCMTAYMFVVMLSSFHWAEIFALCMSPAELEHAAACSS